VFDSGTPLLIIGQGCPSEPGAQRAPTCTGRDCQQGLLARPLPVDARCVTGGQMTRIVSHRSDDSLGLNEVCPLNLIEPQRRIFQHLYAVHMC